jgi:hypothetical protein
MTWSDPESRDTGDLITAAIWNQDVVANMQWLHDNMAGHVAAYVYNSSNIACTGQAPNFLTFDSELFDTDDIHSTTAYPDRLTVPEDGLYLIGGCVSLAYEYSQVTLRIESDALGYLSWNMSYANGTTYCPTVVQVTALASLQAGDYLRLMASHSGASTRYVVADGYYSPSFWIVSIGAFAS